MTFMIERRYGKCKNRDWLAGFDNGSTVWTLGSGFNAAVFSTREGAQTALDLVLEKAEAWENRATFSFAVIRDRSHLPPYFASTDA